VVVVSDADAVVDVLDPVYDALDVPFDPASVREPTRRRTAKSPGGRCRHRRKAFAENP